MKSNILKAILLMFCFSTLMTYGQNQLFIPEKSDKEDRKHFMQHPSLQEKFFQNNENEFFTQEHPFLNTKTKPNAKQLNTSKANKQCLDSVVSTTLDREIKGIYEYDTKGNMIWHTWYEFYELDERYGGKEGYTYDNQGNPTSRTYYHWDYATNIWKIWSKDEWTYYNNGNVTMWIYYHQWNNEVFSKKTEYMYDNNGNKTLEANYYWDDETNNWGGLEKFEWAYDNNSNMTMRAYYQGIWILYKDEWTYDNNGNETMHTYNYKWDNNSYVPTCRTESEYEYTYDNNSNITITLCYWNSKCMYDDTVYYGSRKREYTYDNNNNLILDISYSWNNATNSWRELIRYEWGYDNNGNLTLEIKYGEYYVPGGGKYKREYAYDNNNNLISSIRYEWDNETNNWKLDSKYECTYDNNKNPTLEIWYGWDYETNNWKVQGKTEHAYDNNGNVTMKIDYSWDYETNSWCEKKRECEYNLSYSITDLIYPFNLFYLEAFNMPIAERNFTWSGTDWIQEGGNIFYWSGKEIGISETTKDNSSIKVYPNPTTGEFRIENGELTIENVEIFDIYGKLLSFHHLITSSSHHLINISHFPTGVYFVKIRTEAGEIVRKIVKE